MTKIQKLAINTFGLTPIESEIVEEVCKGFCNRVIAENRFRTEKTVKFHLTNIYKKAKLKSRTELIVEMHRLEVELAKLPQSAA